MLNVASTIILVIILMGLASYSYFIYYKKSDAGKIDQIIPVNPKETITPGSPNPSSAQSPSQDPFARITLNNPNFSNIKTHIERDKNYYTITGEYRPKGQNHDFSILSIFKWALKDRPDATVPYEEIIIDGKHAKHYKDQKRIYVEDIPLAIQYNRGSPQEGLISDNQFETLLNSIQID